MTSSLTALAAAEHVADLRRAAEHSRATTPAPSRPRLVTLRPAEAGDAAALTALAELDEAPALSGEALLALIDADVVAALSLEDGRVISDPFVASRDAVALLKLRARQVLGRAVRQPRRRFG